MGSKGGVYLISRLRSFNTKKNIFFFLIRSQIFNLIYRFVETLVSNTTKIRGHFKPTGYRLTVHSYTFITSKLCGNLLLVTLIHVCSCSSKFVRARNIYQLVDNATQFWSSVSVKLENIVWQKVTQGAFINVVTLLERSEKANVQCLWIWVIE